MFNPSRSIRSLAANIPITQRRPTGPPLTRHLAQRNFCFCRATSSRQHHRVKQQRSALDPVYLLVAGVVSVGIAFVASAYNTTDKSIEEESTALSQVFAPVAEDWQSCPAVMAANMPPGRPGNLTADQEAKLKEMWAATLDVFGVAHETPEASTNGTSTPVSEATTDGGKKKHKSRLSLFKKTKDRHGTDGAATMDGEGNDKHGQQKEYQQALASQSPEQLREAFWSMVKHDHPDALLLRFLRARKWDVHAALVMLISTMHWRSQEMHVDDDVMARGEMHALRESKASGAAEKKEGADFMAQLRMGKSYLHGCDKDGRPLCVVRVRLHKQGEQSEKSLERFTVYTIETARMLLRPPVDTATIVFDMTDFTMANMDYTPVKFMIKCFEANYPESLGSVLVYKSPWLFQGIWKIIRGWLDPVVAAKVHFASNVDELSEWIPKAQIPAELGGAEQWRYEYVEPREGENDAMSDSAAQEKVQSERTELVKSYEHEVSAWCNGEGSGEGRMRLAQRLSENYWKLDPYVRARSLYDRTNVLQPGGRLELYPRAGGGSGGGGDDDGGVD